MNSNLLKWLKKQDGLKSGVSEKNIKDLELALSKYTYLYCWSPIYTNDIDQDIIQIYDLCIREEKTLLFFYRAVFQAIYNYLLDSLNGLYGSLKNDYMHDLNIINHCLYYYLY